MKGNFGYLIFTLLLSWIQCFQVIADGHNLDHVASPTTLSAPRLKQLAKDFCFVNPQTHYGLTVDQWGHGLSYGRAENVSQAKINPKDPKAALWGKPGIELQNGNRCCNELTEVREYIDYIDKTILTYMALRQQFVLEAGRFKTSKESLRAVDRAVKVIADAEEFATKVGLAPWVANITYTAAVNSFAQLELCKFDEDVRTDNRAT